MVAEAGYPPAVRHRTGAARRCRPPCGRTGWGREGTLLRPAPCAPGPQVQEGWPGCGAPSPAQVDRGPARRPSRWVRAPCFANKQATREPASKSLARKAQTWPMCSFVQTRPASLRMYVWASFRSSSDESGTRRRSGSRRWQSEVCEEEESSIIAVIAVLTFPSLPERSSSPRRSTSSLCAPIPDTRRCREESCKEPSSSSSFLYHRMILRVGRPTAHLLQHFGNPQCVGIPRTERTTSRSTRSMFYITAWAWC